MDCPQCQRLLTAYVDDEIEKGERDRVEAHLARCADCRHQHARVTETLRLAAAWFPEDKFGRQALALQQQLSRLEVLLLRCQPPAVMTEHDVMAYLAIGEAELCLVLSELPRIDIAGECRFLRSSIDAWLRDQEVPAQLASERAIVGGGGEVAGPLLPPCVGQTRSSIALL